MPRLGFFSLPRETRDDIYGYFLENGKPYDVLDKDPFNWHNGVAEALRPICALKHKVMEAEATEYLISHQQIAIKDSSVKDILRRPCHVYIGGERRKGINLGAVFTNIRHLELTLSYKQAHIIGGKVASTGSVGHLVRLLPHLKTLDICYQRWLSKTDRRLKEQLVEPLVIYDGWITSLETIRSKIDATIDASNRLDLKISTFLVIQDGNLDDRVLVNIEHIIEWWYNRGGVIAQDWMRIWNNGALVASISNIYGRNGQLQLEYKTSSASNSS